MKRGQTRAPILCVGLPISMLLPAAFFLLGALCGGAVSAHGAAAMGDELRHYLDSYLALRTAGELSSAAVWQTLGCFFRASAAVFLFGFASIGVALIPLLCASQGFLYAYALACFAAGLGREGFFLLPILFAVRLLVVLPCTLLLGSAAWETSRSLAAASLGKGKRSRVIYGRAYWSRFGKACMCLCFGAALELWLVPRLLTLLL